MPAFTLLIIASLVCWRCTDPEPAQPGEGNLLANGSFEANGQPSFVGWTMGGDSSLIRTETAAGIPCGGYALTVETGWGITYVEASVAGLEGTHVYRLDFRGRADGRGGSASLGLDSNGPSAVTVTVADSSWHQYSLTDTLAIPPGARVRVRLHGAFSQLERGKTWYDCVSLEKVE